MKLSRNIHLLVRLVVIPASLLLITFLLIKVPALLQRTGIKKEKPAPVVKSFGIIIPKGYSIHGIDVSKHQGQIDWQRVSKMKSNNIEISFVFIKATEGITRQDNMFKTNWKQSAQNGLLRGAYHFFYPSRDADKQADNFIKTVKLSSGDLPPVVDIEVSNGRSAKKIREALKTFILRLEKQYNVKPIIYTNINFYNTFLKGEFKDYPLWIAGYFDHDRFYSEFETPWIIWQHSEKGRVDGIRGNVDFNVFNGNFEKLKMLRLK